MATIGATQHPHKSAPRPPMDLNYLITDTIENPASSNHLIDCGFRLFDPITLWAKEASLYWRKELN
jgi:hypothetical protein